MPVWDTDGHLLTNEDDQIKRWSGHFRCVLNRAPPDNPVDEEAPPEVLAIDTEPPRKQEIMKALKKLKSGKSPGVNNVSAEILKVDMATTAEQLGTK